MAKKKNKKQHLRAVPVGELVRQAEEQLQNGQVAEAMRTLLRAEAEVGRKKTVEGAPISPHQAAWQPQIVQLLARAFFERALAAENPSKTASDLEEAVNRAPSQMRYRLALGACQLILGEPEKAFEHFQKAHEAMPDDRLAFRAFVLGFLATGRTREVKEQLKHLPEEKLDAHLKRLAAIRELAIGNVANITDRAGASANQGIQSSPPAAQSQVTEDGSRALSALIGNLTWLVSGDAEKAGEQLAAAPALDHNPSRAEAAVLATQLFYSGASRFQTARFKEAAADFREAQRLAQSRALRLPWLDRLAAYHHQLAERALSENDLELAVACWQHALNLDPHDTVAIENVNAARLVQANQAWRGGQAERAVELWKECLRATPRDERLLKNLAIGYEKAAQTPEAIVHWRLLTERWRQQVKTAATDDKLKERLLRLEQRLVGMMIEADRPSHEILNEMESALKIDPSNPELRRKYANLFLEIGRPQQALKHLKIIEAEHGESADLLVQKGIALDMARKRAEARKCFERALEIDPSHVVARHSQLLLIGSEAAEAEQKGQPERAIEICQHQLSIDPQYTPALAHLAALYFSTRRKAEAKETIVRLIASDPNSPPKRIIAGKLYLEAGLNGEADKEFKQAAEIDSSGQCLFQIGQAYLREGKEKRAFNHFTRAAETGSFALIMDIAGTLHEWGYYEEALPHLDRAMQKDSQHPEPHVGKASVLIESMKLDEAQQELAEAERLLAGRAGFDDLRDAVRSLQRTIRKEREGGREFGRLGSMPPGIGPEMAKMPPEVRRMLMRLIKQL